MELFRKNKQQEKAAERAEELRVRMLVAVGGLFLFAALIAAKLVYVQIIAASDFKEKARRQYESRLTVKANRGIIYDRSMNRLASNLTFVSFAADPTVIDSADKIAKAFAAAFGKSEDSYREKLKQKSQFVWLERRAAMDKAKDISDRKFAGIIELKELNRHYENLAAQVIGFTDMDNAGISGLEKLLDDTLKGTDGFMILQRTASGKSFPSVSYPREEATDGNSVQLTLDMTVQAIVEDELRRGAVSAGASAAMAIVMDVKTGEILAMANYPEFDMNNKATYTVQTTRNRAVTDAFEPGSTFKLVQAVAATEVGLRKADDKVNAENGKWRVKNRVITDHEKLGTVTYQQAIAHSSNIIAAKTALMIGEENFYKTATAFGFGTKTGIDLEGEISGRLKPVKDWSGITLPWMAQGYEVLVTPVQMLSAYAALANDGVLMKPFVVKKVLSPSGKVLTEKRPAEVRRVMKKETARLVREYFKAVVDSGTGIAAQLEGVDAAGKTGTAQKLVNGSYKTGSYASSFVGFFPVERPRVAALVMMDNPTNGYYGSMTAAPVFSRIGSRVANASGEYQEKIAAVVTPKPSAQKQFLDTVKSVAVPNVCGLSPDEAKEVLRLHKLDFKRENEAAGIVVAQGVKSGVRAAMWSKVPLTFSGSEQLGKMPNLVGLRADRAIYEAKQLGLKIRFAGAAGTVVSQTPKAGSAVSASAECWMTMSN